MLSTTTRAIRSKPINTTNASRARRRAAKASERVRWQDPAGRHDPRIAVKLIGINDFHGQLSPRTLGPPTALRPVGGAASLASYLEAAADQAEVRPSSFMRAIMSARRRRTRRCCRMSRRSTCSTCSRTSGAFRSSCSAKLPDFLEPYAQARCNIVGTLGNHEFDEGATEVLRLLTGRQSSQGSVPRPALAGRTLSLCVCERAEHDHRQDTVAAVHDQDCATAFRSA